MAVSTRPHDPPAASAQPLTTRSAAALAAAIRAGETTSRAVVEAHVALLRRVNPALNAVVVDRYDAALADADAADARIAATPAAERDALPPLLGVPCTVKESISLAGMPNCTGLVARAAHRCEQTAPAAQRMLDAGAIPLGVTNTSELCMWIESDNRVYGRTGNAYDATRISGGSSGGEGASVGSGGSPVGLGSDVGGSIRGPAFFNGVFGHKPTPGLVPMMLSYPPVREGSEIARMVANGPLVRRAEDLMPLLRLLSGPDGLDASMRDATLGDPAGVQLDGLRVVVPDDCFVSPIARELLAARERAAGALAAAGARVERISLRSARGIYEPYLSSLGDGPETLEQLMLGEGAARSTWRDLLRGGGPHTAPTRLLIASERLSARNPAKRRQRAIEAGRAFARELEERIGDGVMLFPPYPNVAPRHGGTVGRLWWIHPMAVFNLAGLPATAVPLGLGRAGLPLGVQVAAGPDRDHVSIAVALELERVFGGWVPPA
ncbi:MAG TPA: amidase [Conexibacter sp.]|nr:amidase [Conexibacter sp.]